MAVGKIWFNSSLHPAAVSISPSVLLASKLPESLPATQSEAVSHPDFCTLRFTPETVGTDIQLSASGLVARMSTSGKQLAVMNKSFSSGVHYWELNCPVSCACLEFGVIKSGWPPTALTGSPNTALLVKFKNSTPRVVGVELNFYTLRMSFFLNGRYQEKKCIPFTPGLWSPAISMGEKDTVAVLNPYCTSDDYSGPAYIHHRDLEQDFSSWVGVVFRTQPLSIQQFLLLTGSGRLKTVLPKREDTEEKRPFFFLKFEAKSAALEFVENANALGLDDCVLVPGSCLVAWVVNLPERDNDAVLSPAKAWLKDNRSEFIEIDHIPEKSIIENAILSAKTPIFREFPMDFQAKFTLFYLQHTDKLLAVMDDRLKLVPRRDGKLRVSPLLFTEPQSRSDQIWLRLTESEAQVLIDTVLTRLPDTDFSSETYILMTALGTHFCLDSDHFIHISYEDAVCSVHHLLYLFLTNISEKVLGQASESSLNLLQTIQTLLRWEEELRLSQPTDCTDLWPERTVRLHSAIDRLGSMLCSTDRATLAQNGLMNTKDWFKSVSHYNAKTALLASVSELESQLPNDPLLCALPAPSVPLSVSVFGSRSQRHAGLMQVVSDPDSAWVLTLGSDGCARMWNTWLHLTEVVSVDLTSIGERIEAEKTEMEEETQEEYYQFLRIFQEEQDDFPFGKEPGNPPEPRKMKGNPIQASFVNLENQPEAPLVLVAVSSEGEVLFKRVGFTANYLRRFMTITRPEIGYYSMLTGTWMQNATEARAHFAHYKEALQVLVPINVGKSPSSVWTVTESHDLSLPSSRILSLAVSSLTTSEPHFSVYILGIEKDCSVIFDISVTLTLQKDPMKGLSMTDFLQTSLRLEGIENCSFLVCSEHAICAGNESGLKVWEKGTMKKLEDVKVEDQILEVRRGKGDFLQIRTEGKVTELRIWEDSPVPEKEEKLTVGRLRRLTDSMRPQPKPLIADEYLGLIEDGDCFPRKISGKRTIELTTVSSLDQLNVITHWKPSVSRRFPKQETPSRPCEQLPLMVYHHTGGCYKDGHYPSSILFDDAQAFTSIYPSPTFVFKHIQDVSFAPVSVIVKSNLAAEAGQPLGEGLVFTAMYPSAFQYATEFDGFTQADFTDLKARKRTEKRDWEEWEPVAFFKFEEGDTVKVDLETVRQCRYVLLKPTNLRAGSAKKFKDVPIEIMFFAVLGYEANSDQELVQRETDRTSTSASIEVLTEDHWEQIGSKSVLEPEKTIFGEKSAFDTSNTPFFHLNLKTGSRVRVSITKNEESESSFPVFFTVSGSAYADSDLEAQVQRVLPTAIENVLHSDDQESVVASAQFLVQYINTKDDLTDLRHSIPLESLFPRSLKTAELSSLCERLWTLEETFAVASTCLSRLEDFSPSHLSLLHFLRLLKQKNAPESQSSVFSKIVALAHTAADLRPPDLLKFYSVCPQDLNPFEITPYLHHQKPTPMSIYARLTWNESSDHIEVDLGGFHRVEKVCFVFKRGKDDVEPVRCRVDILSKGDVLGSVTCEEHQYRQLVKMGYPLGVSLDHVVDSFTVKISYFLFPAKKGRNSELYVYVSAFGHRMEADENFPEVPPHSISAGELVIWNGWTQTEYSYDQDLLVYTHTQCPCTLSQLQLSLSKMQTELKGLLQKSRPEIPAVEAEASEIAQAQMSLSEFIRVSPLSYQMTVTIAAEFASFLTSGNCRIEGGVEDLTLIVAEFIIRGFGPVREQVLDMVSMVATQRNLPFRGELIQAVTREFLLPGALGQVAAAQGFRKCLECLRAPAATLLRLLTEAEQPDPLAVSSIMQLCVFSLQRTTATLSEMQNGLQDLLTQIRRLKTQESLGAALQVLSEYMSLLPASEVEIALKSPEDRNCIITNGLDAKLASLLRPILSKSPILSDHLQEMLASSISESRVSRIKSLLELSLHSNRVHNSGYLLERLLPVLSRNFTSLELWKLTLRLAQGQSEHTVYGLVTCFLETPEEVRLALYPDIVKIGGTLMSGGCSNLLKLALEVQSQGIDTAKEASAQALSLGWLGLILETGSDAEALLSPIDVALLLTHLSRLLHDKLRFGGLEAISGMSVLFIQRLEFADVEMTVLMKGFPAKTVASGIGELRDVVERLLEWVMLSVTKEEASKEDYSPGLRPIKQLAGKLFLLLARLSLHFPLEILKSAVGLWRFYSCEILERVKSQELLAVPGLLMANRLMTNLQTVIDSSLSSDALASYFAFEIRGLEFLLEQLVTDSQEQTSPVTDEELASTMTMVNLPGMGFASISAGIDWASYKKGNRNKLFTRDFDDKEKAEIALAFELKKAVELRHISIGLNLFSNEPAERVFGLPASVLVEGGESLDDLRPIAMLANVPDFAYSHFSVGVFAHNFIDSELPISHRVQFLCFRIRRPVFSCLETSTLLLKNCSKVALSISFISVMGYDQTLLQDIPLQISGVYKLSALKLFSRICKPEYTKTMEIIAHEPAALTQIQGSFEMLASMLHLSESWLSQVLSRLSSSNEEMAAWLLDRLLRLSRGPEHARLVYDIIQNDQKHAQLRIGKVMEFVKKSIADLNREYSGDASSRYAPLISFIEALSAAMGNVTDATVDIRMDSEDVSQLLSAIRLNADAEEHAKALNRFLLCLIYPQTDIKIRPNFDLEMTVLEQVYNCVTESEQKTGFEETLKCLIAYSDRAAKWVIEEGKLSFVCDMVEKEDGAKVKYTDLLSGFCVNSLIKQELIRVSMPQHLYSHLKASKPGTKFLSKGVQTLSRMVLGDPESERLLSVSLTSDISLLQSKLLISDLLVPLLSAELQVPLFMHVYDPENKRWVSGMSVKSQTGPDAPQPPFLSKTCSLSQMQEVTRTLQAVADVSEERRTLPSASWNLLFYLDHAPDYSTWLTFHRAIELRTPLLLLFQAESRTRGAVNVAVGLFKALPQVPDVLEDEVTASIPMDKDNFILYMEEGKTFHFECGSAPQRHFGEILCDYEGGGALNLASEFLWISFSYDYSTCLEAGGFMLCKEKDCILPGEMKIKSMEVWTCQLADSHHGKMGGGEFLGRRMQWEDVEHPFTLLQAVPLLLVPAGVTGEGFSKALFKGWVRIRRRGRTELLGKEETMGELGRGGSILNLEYHLNQRPESLSASVDYVPCLSLFESFQSVGGISEILSVTTEVLKAKSDKTHSTWELWIREIQSFCQLPRFFANFIKNEYCKNLLFTVLSGDMQIKDEQTSVTYTYRTLAELFRGTDDAEVRLVAVRAGLIERVFERLEAVGKVQKPAVSDPEVDQDGSSSQSDSKDEKKQKYGTGYAPDNVGANSRWDVNTYFLSKQVQMEQTTALIQVLTHFLAPKDWRLPSQVVDLFQGSALVSFLNQHLGADSLLDINKEKEMFSTFLKLVKVIAGHEQLSAMLNASVPRLCRLADLARTFFKCLRDVGGPEKQSEEIARDILETEALVLGSAHLPVQDQQLFYATALHQPLDQAYKALLEGLRFDYMRMKGEDGVYKHFYKDMVERTGNSPPIEKVYRLAQEIADLSHSLPVSHTNSIFMRVDEERVDLMKALVMGAAGTPYAHGAFEFDLFLEDTYPNSPPKVSLITTGDGQTRFNPNLYNCGKVCLSLLGTWRGYATENWDPKLSTLLQVLLSIQSMIMTEDVYFNEPGFEQEEGTDEGIKKNEAYCNIIKYANAKFAMLEQIRHPPKGFETVIRRHFYLKREEILSDMKTWLKSAKGKEALYTGLVLDHNSTYASLFKDSNEAYHDKLHELYIDLEEELSNLPEPTPTDHSESASKVSAETRKAAGSEISAFQTVDVSDDAEVLVRELNADEKAVTDRWSRYIGAMGLDAVKTQAECMVFISGAGALGAEIAKNTVLSGVKRLVLCDSKPTDPSDLTGHCFLRASDLGRNRAEASVHRLQQLNYYVHVESATDFLTPEMVNFFHLEQYHVVVLTEMDWETAAEIDSWCRGKGVKVICADVQGLFGRVFTDFGDDFVVKDKNGEEMQEYVIEDISKEAAGLVKLVGSTHHNLEDGDQILFKEMQGLNSLNDTLHTVKVVNTNSFRIGDTSQCLGELRGGIAAQIRSPITIKFRSLADNIKTPGIDPTYEMADFEKMGECLPLHIVMLALNRFEREQGRLPERGEIEDLERGKAILTTLLASADSRCNPELTNRLFTTLWNTARGLLPPLCAYIGGLTSQEIIKAITHKFTPIHQLLYFSCSELLDPTPESPPSRLEICIGSALSQKLKSASTFMVGVGAIGCELLKNLALIDFGTEGKITITDPDFIENSNLNRQFLFREKHLRQPKAVIAAAAAIEINPRLNGHVAARLEKVHDETDHIFTEEFFQSQTVVLNALDNIQARKYVDGRCVAARRPLVDSGTLGAKGHVQVILPYKSETYGERSDPEDEHSIPLCTLRMFPEEPLHCIEWARDLFAKHFTLGPAIVRSYLRSPDTHLEGEKLLRARNLLRKWPTTFENCVLFAWKKFQKLFGNDVHQLLHVYPLNTMTSDGQPFWRLPKRPPHPVVFDPHDQDHISFLIATACLKAKVCAIPLSKEADLAPLIIELIQSFPTTPFTVSEQQTSVLREQVESQGTEPVHPVIHLQEIASELRELALHFPGESRPEEFEKDSDGNRHIDFIQAAANCRAEAYSLQKSDWITVKIKAGRIVPALATTTAVVAALQTLETMKIIKGLDLIQLRNSFLNLAASVCTMTEPGVPRVLMVLPQTGPVTAWDRWEVSKDRCGTLKALFSHLHATYGIHPKDVMLASRPIYLHSIMSSKGEENEVLLNAPLSSILVPPAAFHDLRVTFTLESSEEMHQSPPVRIS